MNFIVVCYEQQVMHLYDLKDSIVFKFLPFFFFRLFEFNIKIVGYQLLIFLWSLTPIYFALKIISHFTCSFLQRTLHIPQIPKDSMFHRRVLMLHYDGIFFLKHEVKIKVKTNQFQNRYHCKIFLSHQAQ